MNNLNQYIPKFKQELPSIALLSLLNLLWCFKMPLYISLPVPLNIIFLCLMGVMGFVGTSWIFVNTQTYGVFLDSDYLNGSPDKILFKRIEYSMIVVIATVIATIFWYRDSFNMPSSRYIFGYGYFVLFIALFVKAARRT